MTTTQRSVRRTLLVGALTVGTLDILDAIIFFGVRGVKASRIFQSISAGLLGRAAFSDGMPTVLLGFVLHYGIATTIVLVFWAASRRMPTLAARPFLWGPLYGIGVYLVMYYVVLPLSASGPASHATPIVINELLIHMFGVGIPSALTARAARQPAADAQFVVSPA